MAWPKMKANAQIAMARANLELQLRLLVLMLMSLPTGLHASSVLLEADGTAVQLDSHGNPNLSTKVPNYYKYTGTPCNSSNIGGTPQPEPMPWLWLWFGGSTVSAGGSWKHIATDVQLPSPPQGVPGIQFRIDMWLGPQPAPVPKHFLEKCQGVVPCNFCEYWEHRHMYYDAGTFMKLMTGTSGLPAYMFPGGDPNKIFGDASKGEWLISPIVEMGIPSVCPTCVKSGGGFKAATGDLIHMNFAPVRKNNWRISAENKVGEGRTSLEFDNDIMFERFLAGAVDRGEIDPNDIQLQLARNNTWKWVLAPYVMMRIMTKPRLEDVPNFFVNLTKWSNMTIEQRGDCNNPSDPRCFEEFFKFESGLAIVGDVVGTNEVISYTTFDSWVRSSTGEARMGEDYKYRSCINAIIKSNLKGSIKTKNTDGSHSFTITTFPHGHPFECRSDYYVRTGGACMVDAQCMSPMGKCTCKRFDSGLWHRLLSRFLPCAQKTCE